MGNGKRKIYDESSKPTTNLVGEIFVKEELNLKSLYNFWSSGPKQDLINYINERDNKSFRKKDFKNIDEFNRCRNKLISKPNLLTAVNRYCRFFLNATHFFTKIFYLSRKYAVRWNRNRREAAER